MPGLPVTLEETRFPVLIKKTHTFSATYPSRPGMATRKTCISRAASLYLGLARAGFRYRAGNAVVLIADTSGS